MFKILIITLFLFSNLLFANENILAYNAYNQTLILPKQSEEAKKNRVLKFQCIIFHIRNLQKS